RRGGAQGQEARRGGDRGRRAEGGGGRGRPGGSAGLGRVQVAPLPRLRETRDHGGREAGRRIAGEGRDASLGLRPTSSRRFTTSRMIAGIVLAAGFARRMGRQKLLLQLQGKPVVRWAVERLLPRVEDLVVVTGQDDPAVRDALARLAVRFAVNPRPQAGQASSIAVGVEALKPWTRAVVIALGDQPKTPEPVVPALLAAFAQSGQPIVVPVFRGVQGTPVVFAREVFPELRQLTGDAGARSVVE